MPIVGNDIVDLKDQTNAQKSADLRYLKKILTDLEIKQVQCSNHPDQVLWSYWACKEAAYKVIKKIDSDAAFMPRRCFVCCRNTFADSGFGRLRTAGDPSVLNTVAGSVIIEETKEIPFYIESTSDYVHCVAADGFTALNQVIRQVDVLPPDSEGGKNDPSQFVRSRLTRRLETLFFSAPDSIEIRRDKKSGELLPPKVYLHDVLVHMDISLSHDGRFVAYAFLPDLHRIPV